MNWSKDDGARVTTLEKDGCRLDGEHVILYTCSLSFVSYLADHVGLNDLVELFAFRPAETNERLDGLKGKRLSEWRTEWLRRLRLG